MTSWQVLEGDCREVLGSLPAQSVHTCITSPPYFGLRDYGSDGQIGLEPTPDEFVAALVEVFREVRRVLRDDGTVWLNLGDSYANTGNTIYSIRNRETGDIGERRGGGYAFAPQPVKAIPDGCKQKDLLGIPWLVAFALRADGWYLRSEIVWNKANPMPESVTDRPTKSHEQIFLLSKRPSYFYDADAIREPHEHPDVTRTRGECAPGSLQENLGKYWQTPNGNHPNGRNKRSVWTVATQPFPGQHFAVFPSKLIEPCVLAGAPERACGECGAPWVRVVERIGYDNGDGSSGERGAGDARALSRNETGRSDGFTKPPRNAARVAVTLGLEPSCLHGNGSASGVVLDPFAGAGTTGMVALRHGRSFVGIELNSEYAEMARQRIDSYVRLGFRNPQNGSVVSDEQESLFNV